MFTKNAIIKSKTTLTIIVLLFGLCLCSCTSESDSDNGENYELTVGPNGITISQTGAVTITAVIDPVPSSPVTFVWDTTAFHGSISDEQPIGEIIEVTDSGMSSVDYVATPVGNPGGTETLKVDVLNQDGIKIAEGIVEIIVSPPSEQTAFGIVYEWRTPAADQQDREDVWMYVVWPFIEIPGFDIYDFTLETLPGEGWNIGQIGQTFTYGLGGTLIDRETTIEEFGNNYFELEEDEFARFAGGVVFSNFNENSSNHQESLVELRESRQRYAQAVFTVRVHE